ncbi:hypothetical protein DMUE_2647 [Dictyocoela muelleri]|nr:hypothetical protein DMUE_2647 [Dictyocoela muelleri]
MKPIRTFKSLQKFLEENESFKIINEEVICVVCNKSISYNPKEGTRSLKRHLLSKVHSENKIRYENQISLKETCSITVSNSTFDKKLIEAFTSANIPLHKLQNKNLRSFLQDYTGKTIHDESYYRKMLFPIFDDKRKELLSKLRNRDIYLLFDETTDVNGRYILNILGGITSKTLREKVYLLRTVELPRTNHQTVSQEIINLMAELYRGKIDFKKLRLIISDAALYAVKAVKILKSVFTELKHVTCLAHMLHRLCEKIREISPISNFISSEIKRVLIKNRENQSLFSETARIKLPKFSVLTKWGTWISFMGDIYTNYEQYSCFFYKSSTNQH